MKTTALTLLFFVFSLFLFSQTSPTIQTLYEEGEFQKAIELSKKTETLNENDLFYTGLSFSSLQNDTKALTYFEQLTSVVPYNPDYWFYQGVSASIIGNLQKATFALKKATAIRNDDARYFGVLGEVYMRNNQYDSAYQAFKYAIRLPNCDKRIFEMLDELALYQSKTNIEQALKSVIADSALQSSNFRNAHFYLADLLTNSNPLKADTLLSYLIQLDSADYAAMIKLVQILNAQQQYQRAAFIKQKLYQAYQAQLLPTYLAKEMQIDEFSWKNYKVLVYERFEEGNTVFYKHIFYLMNENHRVAYIIQTESSPAVRNMGFRYVLGKIQNQKHYAYFDLLSKETETYSELKAKVQLILDEKVQPTSTMIWEK